MVPEKGFADLIAAVALLRTPALLTIVGDGPERGRLAAQARATGVPLDLPGRLDAAGLRAAYAASDVVVQPSAREGLGLVAAEALVLGLPVVATDSGGVRDLLDDLVPPGDARALADRIAAVAHDPEGARAAVAPLAARARERLSPAAAADRTLAGWAAASS
jgi:glycosyltransferase involved in cell wall biosynthesis